MENADLLTNATVALDRYRAEEAQLETEISVLQARLELTREFVTALSGKPRLRRARTLKAIENLPERPDRVPGSLAMADAEPPEAA